jgi:excisionase family DNA binding protein
VTQQYDKMALLISVEEAARRLGLKQVTIRLWVACRKMTSVKLGRRVLIPESEIDRLIKQGLRPARLGDRY